MTQPTPPPQPVKEKVMPTYIDIPNPTPTSGHAVTVIAETLYVREDHSTSSPIIEPPLHRGQVVLVGEYYLDRGYCGWYALIERPGWICDKWVR